MAKVLLSLLLMILAITGCADKNDVTDRMMSYNQSSQETYTSNTPKNTVMKEGKKVEKHLTLFINGMPFHVTWEDNESVSALLQLVEHEPLTINMENYGGFEQVGALPQNIESSDTQIITEPGDIVLYSGNSIVIFYDSNIWSYTKLGHIEELSKDELENILTNEQVAVTLSVSED